MTDKKIESSYHAEGHVTGYGATLDTYRPATPGLYAEAAESTLENTAREMRRQIADAEENLRRIEIATVMQGIVKDFPNAASVDVEFTHNDGLAYTRAVVFDADGKFVTVDVDTSEFSETTVRLFVAEMRKREGWASQAVQVRLHFNIADWIRVPVTVG